MARIEPTQLVPKSAAWQVIGSFLGEPAWDRMSSEILGVLRDWPFSDTGVDWKREGGIFRGLVHDVSYNYSVWPHDYRPGRLSYRRFSGSGAGDEGLSVGHLGSLLKWVKQWGPPAVVVWSLKDDPYMMVQSPVLKLQYESTLMRLVLRIASESSRANCNPEAIERDLGTLDRLWPCERSVGIPTTAHDPRMRGLERAARVFTARLVDLSFGLSVNLGSHRIEHDFEGREGTRVDIRPTGSHSPLQRALIRLLRHTDGLVTLAGFEDEVAIIPQAWLSQALQKILWWHASLSLHSVPLVQCSWERRGERCPAQWFAQGKQKRDFEEGKRVWCPEHRNRRPRRDVNEDREKARLRMRRRRGANRGPEGVARDDASD